MNSRRDFLKKALLLAAGGGVGGVLPSSIQRAFAIDPAVGSSYLDAEHVVILMQENRSFDHTFGSLQGVRGFNDPRAITLPNGNPVWLQTNAAGESHVPFRLDIKDTKATWMGSLPHGRESQIAARNHGKHNGWLDAKKNSKKEFAHVPLTLGYYTREDIPFYYALADAFTICDQNFCSSLTPTTPNRLHLWTGTLRPEQKVEAKAHVNNEETDYDAEVSWKTFPERLEENNISWRVYQNEISVSTGLEGEHDAWLTNFGDNPLEYFTQYHVRFSASHRAWLEKRARELPGEIESLEAVAGVASAESEKKLAAKRAELENCRRELERWSASNFAALPSFTKNLHRKAFTVNASQPDFRELAERGSMLIPKGDLLHQFREDVRSGNLPMVSWLVPPERVSDHPSSPWYGAWYLSETFDILTQNPEVWRKTIFILCYDENDGYFDHVPPFVPPLPNRSDTGKASAGIDVSLEHVSESQGDQNGPIGLGFRVPLLIASPWSRGGRVCSQVFDHTSILMFLEKFLRKKTGKAIRETNISEWRRTVCGDLTSAFHPYNGEKITLPAPVKESEWLAKIYNARNKPEPATWHNMGTSHQEIGVRPSCALPYDLALNGGLGADRKSLVVRFAAHGVGSPFHVYSPVVWRNEPEPGHTWDYAVAAGDTLEDSWALEDFQNGIYYLRAHAPNGFFREFHGDARDPMIDINLSGAVIKLFNRDPQSSWEILIEDVSYGGKRRSVKIASASTTSISLELANSHNWYDIRLSVAGNDAFWRRYAGRVENGKDGFTDPVIGRSTAM